MIVVSFCFLQSVRTTAVLGIPSSEKGCALNRVAFQGPSLGKSLWRANWRGRRSSSHMESQRTSLSYTWTLKIWKPSCRMPTKSFRTSRAGSGPYLWQVIILLVWRDLKSWRLLVLLKDLLFTVPQTRMRDGFLMALELSTLQRFRLKRIWTVWSRECLS